MKICIRFSLHPRFYGYSYRDEMVADAIYTCLSRGVDKIDPDRPGSNPFSYFTAIAFNCFRGRINSEKKFMETKKRFREINTTTSNNKKDYNKHKIILMKIKNKTIFI